MYMKAAQQKNCTSPTFQNIAGAFLSSSIQLALLSSVSGFASLYSAYSSGGHSFTFTVVYITQRMSMAAPM